MSDALDPLSAAYCARHGARCARRRVTALQLGLVGSALAALGWDLWRDPLGVWFACSLGLAAIVTLIIAQRLLAMLAAWCSDPTLHVAPAEMSALEAAMLPRYAVLVPLYREPEVVPRLLTALTALDYPSERLDILLLLEPDDAATRAAIATVALPGHIRVLLAPEGAPRTKPRACNAGLAAVPEAELLVIYDAEDRPEPDQLRKAVAAYRRLPAQVACLQCRLAHYNSRQSIATRWSAMEYLLWFRDLLPGLRRLGWAVPLGGTSNHFRAAVLRDLGGWDPFNVTEDADLGLRLARAGHTVELLDSTTWEEAVPRLGGWIGQRSRWLKGYLQTALVHSRAGALRELGPWRWAGAQLLIGGTVLLAIANPLCCWGVIAVWLLVGWSLVDVSRPLSALALALSAALLAANLLLVLLGAIGCWRHRRADLIPAALLAPLAWLLQSVAAWRAAAELCALPFFWAKTAHGRRVVEDAGRQPRRFWRWTAGLAALVLLTAGSLGLGLLAQRNVQADVVRQLTPRAVQEPVPLLALVRGETDLRPLLAGRGSPWRDTAEGLLAEGPGLGELAWNHAGDPQLAEQEALLLSIALPADAPDGLRVLWHLRDEEGRWFQQLAGQWLLPGRRALVVCDLRSDAAWQARGHGRRWHPQLRHRLSGFGFSITVHRPWSGALRLERFAALDLGDEPAPTVCELIAPPSTLPRLALAEWRCRMERSWDDPDDLAAVRPVLRLTTPSGGEEAIDGFWYQDYARSLVAGREHLDPRGEPEWRWRWRPREAGPHRWSLHIAGADGEVPLGSGELLATPSDHPGHVVRSAAKPQYLALEDGTAWWPIGHNLCQAVDLQQPFPYPFAVPPDQGTVSYERFFQRMQAAGMDWARLWLTPWSFGLEGPADWPGFGGVGVYNPEHAWQLDRVLAEAERRGIRLVFTTTHKSAFARGKRGRRGNWEVNPYNRANGGPLERAEDFFTDPTAREAWRAYLRYLVARYGHSPQIVAWEFFGECNLMPGFDPLAAAAWHDDLAIWIRRQDHGRHLVFTHAHNWQRGHDLWALDAIDCVQGNGYIRPPNRSPDHCINFTGYLAEVATYGKPVFVAEYGGRSELGAPDGDYLEAQLHSGLWASAVQPFAGVAFQWWWNFTDGADLYPHYAVLAAVMRHIDHLAHEWRAGSWPLRDPAGALRAAAFTAADRALLWVHHRDCFTRWTDLPTIAGAQLHGDAMPPGRYRLRCWHTHGEGLLLDRQVELGPGSVIELPPVDKDLAVLLEPSP